MERTRNCKDTGVEWPVAVFFSDEVTLMVTSGRVTITWPAFYTGSEVVKISFWFAVPRNDSHHHKG